MSLLSYFHPVHKFLSPAKVEIDNTVFWLQHKVTVAIFIVFGILSTANTFFGNPIQCFSRDKKINGIINHYCWVTGTYTIKELTVDQAGAAHPGVGTFDYQRHNKIYHVYYQWICFAIFFQMSLFLLPRLLWKKLEAGRIMSTVADMKSEVNGEELDKRVEKLLKSFRTWTNRNYFYFHKFIICEILNLVNILIQFYLTNKFLGGLFKFYGLEYVKYYLRYHGADTVDPFQLVFPKVAKCDFAKHGPGGDIIDHDIMCVLPLNIINEKIYLLMWVWLSFLAILNICNFLYRVLIISIPNLPNWTLRFENVDYASSYPRLKHRLFMNSLQASDIFILELFSKNIDEKTFRNLLGRIVAEQNVEKYTIAMTNWGTNAHVKLSKKSNAFLYAQPNHDVKLSKLSNDEANGDIKLSKMSTDEANDDKKLRKISNGEAIDDVKLSKMSNGDVKLSISEAYAKMSNGEVNGDVKLSKMRISQAFAKINKYIKESNARVGAIHVGRAACPEKDAEHSNGLNTGQTNGLDKTVYMV